jgi:DNA-directed RNA polymerase I subunit RPA1
MTFCGKIRAMNRNWMNENISPFLKMSFETCVKFLTDAACTNEVDACKTPSAEIVLGRVPNVGTGSFSIMHKL